MKEFFLWLDEKQAGPYSADQVRELLQSGKADTRTLFSSPGEQWKELREAPMFFPDRRAAAPADAGSPLVEPELMKLKARAASLDLYTWHSLVAAGVCFCITVVKVAYGEVGMFAALTGGFLSLAGFLAILAQLVHIRVAMEKLSK